MLPSILLAVVSLVPTSQTSAGIDELIPREDFFAPQSVSVVRLAPDGGEVAWIDVQGELPRLRRRPRGDQPPYFSGEDLEVPGSEGVRDFAFCGTGGYLLLAHGTLDPDRRLWWLPPGGGEAQVASPEGMAITTIERQSPRHPGRVCVRADHTHAYNGALYRLQLPAGAGGEASSSGQPGPPEPLARDLRFRRFLIDGDLRLRAGVLPPSRGGTLMRFDGQLPERDRWTSLASYTWDEGRGSLALSVSDDGTTVYAVCGAGRDRSALLAYDLESGEATELAEHPLADWVPGGATIDPNTGAVRAVVAYFGRLRRHLLEPELARDFERLGTEIDGDVSFVASSRDDDTWLLRRMNGGPLVYYAYHRPSGRVTRLFDDQPSLRGKRLARRRTHAVATRDGLVLPIQVYLPPGSDADGDGVPEAPLPTVFYVHGGPWVGFEWNSWFTNRSFQFLANRGYAVVRCEFRGAGGYGQRFIESSNHRWATAMHEDILDITEFTVEHGITDRDRMALWGWSFGGYRAFAALTHSPEHFACALSMYGLSDLLGFTQALYEQNPQTNWRTRVGDVATEEGRTLLREHSPLYFADRVTKPLYVTHGALDDRAPKSQSDVMVDALLELGKPVTYTVYPEEGHDYRAAASWISYWAIGEHFLAQHLGGRAEPFGAAFEGANFEVVAGAGGIPGLEDAID